MESTIDIYTPLSLVGREETARGWLLRNGNLAVPCSRYGRDTETCAEIALLAEGIMERGTGEATSRYSVDEMMGLVVNDSDAVHDLIMDHGSGVEIETYFDLGGEG